MKQLFKSKAIKIFLFAFPLLIARTTYAQMGIGTANPAPSAQLDVSSTTRGFLPPRMTQAQRNAIVNPAPGLMIWCSDCGLTGEILVFNGIAWTKTSGREGTNYYVNQLDGNDANDGKTMNTAWKTLAPVNSNMSSFKPGDSILFQKDGYYFGPIVLRCSGTPISPIVFGAYGNSKAKPIFTDAVRQNESEDWVSLGNKMYENKHLGFNIDVANLVFNGKTSFGKKIMSSTEPVLTSQGEFWYDFTNRRILIYSDSNPASKYKDIQCVRSENAIEGLVNSSYLVFENLKFIYYGKCVVETGGSNCSFRNLDISYIGGADLNNQHQSRFGNGIQMLGDINNVTITGCRIDNIYGAGITALGFSGNTNNVYIRNNVISNCAVSFDFLEGSHGRYVHDIFFEHNTCVNAGAGWSNPNGIHVRIQLWDGIKSNFFIRNNIFYGATQSLFDITDNYGTDFFSDYNDFYKTSLESIGTRNLTPAATLPEWQQATSRESNSMNVDPLFISSKDFHLRKSSPVIGKGIDVGYGKDMGAYPYIPAGN